MRKTLFCLLFLTFSFFFSFLSCSSPEKETSNELAIARIQNSYNKWLDVKQGLKNTYSYTVYQKDSSSTTLSQWSNTIYVEEDKVVCRFFQNIDNLSATVWLETVKDLGKHNEGIPVNTLDEVYGRCLRLAYHDPNYQLFFSINETGVMKSCYFEKTPETYPDYYKISILNFDKSKCSLNKLWKR